MNRKFLIVFSSLVCSVLLVLRILVIFLPCVIIDGRPYSQKEIVLLKKRCIEHYTQILELLSTKVNDIIENEFLNYINKLDKLSSFDKKNTRLAGVLKTAYADMNIAEEQFTAEFEYILRHKEKKFILPLQVRNITTKNIVLQDIFSTKVTNYSVENQIYDGIVVNILIEKLAIFQKELPRIADTAIENMVNSQYEQCLSNLNSRIDMGTSINNAVQDAVAYFRYQGESLCFFEYLMEEGNITQFPLNRQRTVEFLDISHIADPVLLPVCVINETVYDYYSIKSFSEKLKALRNDWRKIRESQISSIIKSKWETIAQNFAARDDIDNEVKIEELSAIITYYEKQMDISRDLFPLAFEQCRLSLDNISDYKNEIVHGFDVAPLEIPVVAAEDAVYDTLAAQILTEEIAAFRTEWSKIRNEGISSIIKSQRKIIAQNLASRNDIDNEINIEELSVMIQYYARQMNISKDLFPLSLEQCRLSLDNISDYKNEIVHGFDVAPLEIPVVAAEDAVYDTLAVQILTEEIAAIGLEWERFSDSEYEKIQKDVDQKLQGYFNTVSSDEIGDIGVESIVSSVDYLMEQADVSGDLFIYFYECCSVPMEYANQYINNNDVFIFDYTPLAVKAVDIDGGIYCMAAVNALQESMHNHANVIVGNMRSGLSEIINSKTNECLNNVEPYLAWYFDWLANDLLTVGLRKLKEVLTNYNEENKLYQKYQQHFYPTLEMGNDIQNCLLRYNNIIQNLALGYIMVLEEFQMASFLTIEVEKIMEGNEFMKPYQQAPDYLQTFILNVRKLLELSYTNPDDIKVKNTIRIAANTGAEFAIDATSTAVGAAIGGPPGAVIGFAVGIIAGFVTDAVTSKAVETSSYNEYREAMVNSFEKNRRDLLAIL